MLPWRLAGGCVGRGRVQLRSSPTAAGKQQQASAWAGARRMPLFGIRVAPNFGHGPTDLFGYFLPESRQVFLPRFRARKRYRFLVPVGVFCESYAYRAHRAEKW